MSGKLLKFPVKPEPDPGHNTKLISDSINYAINTSLLSGYHETDIMAALIGILCKVVAKYDPTIENTPLRERIYQLIVKGHASEVVRQWSEGLVDGSGAYKDLS